MILLPSAHPLCRALHGDADRHGAAAVHLEAEGVHGALQRRPQPATLPRGPETAGAGAHQRPAPPLAGTQRAGEEEEQANRDYILQYPAKSSREVEGRGITQPSTLL